MASINKSFNFRHGVQVEDNDFTVRGSLVGIGTTVPTERLDVRGNAVVSGFTSSVYLNVSGVSTFIGHANASTVGASGSITAPYFYGDGSNLTQIPTSQWVDVDVGLGYTSIYNTGGNVGVGTTDPRHTIQVGGDPTFGSIGVGIHSLGNIHATGVVTATKFVGEFDSPSLDTNAAGIIITGVATATSKFVGPIDGNVTGNVTGNVNGNVNATTVDSSTLNVTGVATAASFVGPLTGAVTGTVSGNVTGNVTGNLTGNVTAVSIGSTDINVSGVSTFSGNIDANGDIDVDGHTELDNVNVSGVLTATSFIGNVTGNVVGDVTANGIGVTSLNVAGVSTFTGNANFSGNIDVDGLTELDDVNVAGACTITGNARIGDVLLSNTNTRIGIGTNPLSDLQIQKTTESAIVLGRSQAITGTNASIRFGTTNASFPYSAHTPESLDIINYGKGNVNFYLEAGVAGVGTGGFFWHRRSSFDQLMSLTYDAKLGIGVTVPDNTLHVVGTSTITDNAWFGNNVTIKQNLTVAGTTTLGAVTITNISSDVVGNVYAASGISTFKNLKTDGWVEFENVNGLSGVGIGTTASGNALTVGSQPATGGQSFMTGGGNLCLNNAAIMPGINLDARDSRATFKVIGVGATNPDAGADFGNCGYTTSRHMILPKVTTTERGNLNAVTNGSIIYNTSTNKFQGRANGAWVDLH